MSAVATELNKSAVFGIRNWHQHMHSLVNPDAVVALCMFDWIKISSPCLITTSRTFEAESSDNAAEDDLGFKVVHQGFPTHHLPSTQLTHPYYDTAKYKPLHSQTPCTGGYADTAIDP